MKVIVVANQKGGVAKTTTAGAIASAIARGGNRVLAVDMDPQGNFTDNCNAEQSDMGVYAVLKDTATVAACVQHSELYDVLAASIALAAVEQELSGAMGREYRLREALAAPNVTGTYDFVVIDTPPALGTLTINALVAADYVLIPSMADINATKGISQLNDTIRNVRKYFNPNLKIAGILLTRFDRRLNISKAIQEVAENAANVMGTKLYGTVIRASVVAPESNYTRTDLFAYAPDSTVSEDYQNFMSEFVTDLA